MIVRIGNKLSPLCYMPNGTLVCYKYGDVVLLKEGKEIKRIVLFNGKKERWLGRCKLIFRLLRLGIRAAIAINGEIIVISVGSMLYEVNILTGNISEGYFCGNGVRPLVFSIVNEIDGFNNGVYFGGYTLNRDRNPVYVYHRTGIDRWEVVYTFPQGSINHVHTIVSDTYRQCLWIFTGDFEESSAIWKVNEGFSRLERVACNDQKYRGCVAFALPEGILYATDAPYADDFIYLMNPDTYEVKKVASIDGSCIYGCQWKDKYVFSSTVEGDGRNLGRFEFLFSRKRGTGIKDNYVHMYSGNIADGFKEIYKEKKDCMPFYSFQFGVFKFPFGLNKTDVLYFQPVATGKNDLDLIEIKC